MDESGARPERSGRKVRAPQGKALASGEGPEQSGYGKRHRKENDPKQFGSKLKRWCKRPPAVW